VCIEGHTEICGDHAPARFLVSLLEPTSNLTCNFWMPAGSDRCTVHDLGISHALLTNNTVLQEVVDTVSVENLLLKLFRLSLTNYQESGDFASLCQGCQHSEWLKCCHLQGYDIPRILRRLDQRRWRHHVHSEHREPFNPWHSTTPPVLINSAARTWDNGVISQKTFYYSDVQYFWHLLRFQSHFHKGLGLP
jgi:hypothetical protein